MRKKSNLFLDGFFRQKCPHSQSRFRWNPKYALAISSEHSSIINFVKQNTKPLYTTLTVFLRVFSVSVCALSCLAPTARLENGRSQPMTLSLAIIRTGEIK